VPGKNILIFTAVRMETRAVQQALDGSACRVHTLGIRARHLPARSELNGISTILMCGVAGGLDPSLAVGDIILDDPKETVPGTVFCRRGRIHTAAQIIAGPADKAALFHQTGALAVDMEQAIVAEYLANLDIQLIGVRAISDTATQMLDPAVVHFVNDLGDPRPIKIATTLIRRPQMIPYLLTLNKNTNIALKELGKAVKAIVDRLALAE
jgi:adenosylhomocysteine nucleosidase